MVRWMVPEKGTVKLNWDAAYDKTAQQMGAGIVMRDSEGEVLVSLCVSKLNVGSPFVAETVALWRALTLCEELNVWEAVFEGDALGVIQAINSKEESWEWSGQLIEDIRGILVNRPLWKIQHIYREGNKLAHFLATFAYNVKEEQVWIEDGPKGYFSFFLQDKFCNDNS